MDLKLYCTGCGSTDPEDVDVHELEGYSRCCNKVVDW